MMLEQQKMMLESANFDRETVSTIIKTKEVYKQIVRDTNIDDVMDIKEELDELMEE